MGGSESAPGYHYVKVRGERDPPVTAMATWRAKPGREAELERFIGSIVTQAMRFSGHLGTVTLRPAEDGDRTYRVVFRFDHVSIVRRWERSEERRHWLQLAKDAGVADAAPDVDVVTGLEIWFTLPGRRSIVPPPRLKMALASWTGIYPQITTVFPLPLRTLVLTGVLVPTMAYAVMPLVTWLLRRWLYPTGEVEPRGSPRRDLTLPVSRAAWPRRPAPGFGEACRR